MITEIHVEPALLPQVIGELLQFAVIPDDVQVTDGPQGRLLLVRTEVADAWFDSAQSKEQEPEEQEPEEQGDDDQEPEEQEQQGGTAEPVEVTQEQQEPVKRKRGRPRKITSATVGEDVL